MEDSEKKQNKAFKKLRNHLILLLVFLIVGFALGYYFGYDMGFEKAARILAN